MVKQKRTVLPIGNNPLLIFHRNFCWQKNGHERTNWNSLPLMPRNNTRNMVWRSSMCSQILKTQNAPWSYTLCWWTALSKTIAVQVCSVTWSTPRNSPKSIPNKLTQLTFHSNTYHPKLVGFPDQHLKKKVYLFITFPRPPTCQEPVIIYRLGRGCGSENFSCATINFTWSHPPPPPMVLWYPNDPPSLAVNFL